MKNQLKINEIEKIIKDLELLKAGIEEDQGKGTKQWFSIMDSILNLKDELILLKK
jgi:hypothetical protein